MPRDSYDQRVGPTYRESLRTLALFYIRLYRALTLSAIEDTYIKDTPSRALSLGIPTLLLFTALRTAFQVLPQLGQAAVIMMPDITVRSAQEHRNLLERVPLEKAQLQRRPLLHGQVFEGPLDRRFAKARFQAVIIERHGLRALYGGRVLSNFFRRIEILTCQIASS